jgi:hypothetical protein
MATKKTKILREALTEWKDDNLLSEDLFQRLSKSVSDHERQLDWKKLSKWSFAFALCSLILALAIATLPIIERWPQFDIKLQCYLTGFLSAIFYVIGLNFARIRFLSFYPFVGKIILLLGCSCTAACLELFAEAVDLDPSQHSLLVLAATIIYGSMGYVGRSAMIWSFALITLGCWLGEADFFSMAREWQFVSLGIILILLSFIFNSRNRSRVLTTPTLFFGLFYLLMTLWFLSILGMENFNTPFDLLCLVILFAVAAVLCIYFGLRNNIPLARRFGIIFLGINLITQYCEHSFHVLGEITFFSILGVIFLAIAIAAKRTWQRRIELRRGSEQGKASTATE